MSDLSNQAQKLLGGFYKTVDVMKSAYSKNDKEMSVWAEDIYAVEAVMSFLETIRDAPAQEVLPWRQSDEAIRNMIAREIWRYQECEEAYGPFDDNADETKQLDIGMRSLIKQTAIDQAELIRVVVLASPIVKTAIARLITEDDIYEIGKRDGYEDAVQELDIFTGGDGEFKGSTLPGGTVDVPTMMARVKARFGDAMSFADLRDSGGIFPEACARSGQKIADIEILQQKLEFAEWEWDRATEGMKERDVKIVLLESRVERADDLINDLLCLELGASERAFEYLVERGIIVTVPSTDSTGGAA